MFELAIVTGGVVNDIIRSNRQAVVDAVTRAYELHEDGATINPDSYFLRFPDKPDSRIIALPAYVGGAIDTVGIKWISSFPGNHDRNLPRASAVLILNDYATGRPIACLEGAAISAARTAASAAIAAAAVQDGRVPRTMAFVGTGVIARAIAAYLDHVEAAAAEVLAHDTERPRAERFAAESGGRAVDLETAMQADLVVLATTAARPYVPADVPLRPGQVVLNVSLRDLEPHTLLRTNNIVDDIDHCLKAQTSPHLAEQLTGGRDFIDGTIGALLRGKVSLNPERATVVSPFGLGVLDLAVGAMVLGEARRAGLAVTVADFIP